MTEHEHERSRPRKHRTHPLVRKLYWLRSDANEWVARLVRRYLPDRNKLQVINLTEDQERDYLRTANEIASRLGLQAEFLGDAMAVGVVGDNRAYTRIINLVGPPPDLEALAKVSTEISNILPIIKVTYQLNQSVQNT